MPKDKTRHTPTPWRQNGDMNIDALLPNRQTINIASTSPIGRAYNYQQDAILRDNAEHIVRCVNSHDALMTAWKI